MNYELDNVKNHPQTAEADCWKPNCRKL